MNIYGQVVRMEQCANDFFRIAVKIGMVESTLGQVMIMNPEHEQAVTSSATDSNNNVVLKSTIRFVYIFKGIFQQCSSLVLQHFISGESLLFCCCIESNDLYVYYVKKINF